MIMKMAQNEISLDDSSDLRDLFVSLDFIGVSLEVLVSLSFGCVANIYDGKISWEIKVSRHSATRR